MKYNPFSLFAVILATSAVVSSASAANLTWIDTNTNNAWNLTELNWNPGPVAWTDSNNAIFAGTAETVALETAISAGAITVNTTGYTLALANNTLAASSLNYGGAVAGTFTLTGGAGTTNAMNVVTLNGVGSGWASDISLNLNGNGNPAAGAATENGKLLKLVFGNASALGSAELKVQHGMIQAGAGGMTITNPISIQTGSLYFGGENNLTVSGLIKQNTGNSRTVGVWEGATGSRTITLGNMDTDGAGFFNFEARGAVPATPNTGGGFIVNGAITGIGGISTVGATQFVGNTVTLNGTNTYSGKTDHFSGIIAVSAIGSITATSGVAVNTTALMTNAGAIISAGALTLNGNGPTGGTLSTSGTASFATAGLNGNLNLRGGSITVSGQFNVGENAGNYGVINQSAGTMNLTTAVAGGIRIGHWTTTTPALANKYNLSGGTLNVANTSVSVGWDGVAEFAISSGTANLMGLANGGAGHGGNPSAINLTGGRLNIGSAGISQNGGGAKVFNLGAATVGAFADWTGSARMELIDTTTGTQFDTLDSADTTTARAITISGVISGVGKLVKTGVGTMKLTGENTYTGNTIVSGGVLAVSGNSIADAGKLVISGGKVDPSGSTEVVDSLVLGGVGKIAGTYGSNASAATYKSDVFFVTGSTGVINVTSSPAGNDYANWISKFSVGALTGPNDDFDNDGLDNSVENALGSDPSASSTGLTAVSATGNSFKFRHNQSNEIASDVTKSYQFSTDLIDWKASGGTTNGTTATITEAIITDTVAPANDVIEVTVTVTSGPAVKVFARLVATQG